MLPLAEDDLDGILSQIEQHSLSAAARIQSRILEKAAALSEFPRVGKSVSVLSLEPADMRFTASGKYLIFYKISGYQVIVHRVRHSAMNPEMFLAQDNKVI